MSTRNRCAPVFLSAGSPELVARLAGRFDRLKASGVTTAATIKPTSFDSAHVQRQAPQSPTFGG
jgi:hypothetical protein